MVVGLMTNFPIACDGGIRVRQVSGASHNRISHVRALQSRIGSANREQKKRREERTRDRQGLAGR